MLVFVGGVLTIGFPTAKFFPMLEMVPLVGKTTWDVGSPPGVKSIWGVEIDGELWVGREGMEG